MRRSATTVVRQPSRKSGPIATHHAVALAAWSAGSTGGVGPIVPVTKRVRDGLVLRLVASKNSSVRSQPDERRAR